MPFSSSFIPEKIGKIPKYPEKSLETGENTRERVGNWTENGQPECFTFPEKLSLVFLGKCSTCNLFIHCIIRRRKSLNQAKNPKRAGNKTNPVEIHIVYALLSNLAILITYKLSISCKLREFREFYAKPIIILH